jgi:chromosome segregation ATPase
MVVCALLQKGLQRILLKEKNDEIPRRRTMKSQALLSKRGTMVLTIAVIGMISTPALAEKGRIYRGLVNTVARGKLMFSNAHRKLETAGRNARRKLETAGSNTHSSLRTAGNALKDLNAPVAGARETKRAADGQVSLARAERSTAARQVTRTRKALRAALRKVKRIKAKIAKAEAALKMADERQGTARQNLINAKTTNPADVANVASGVQRALYTAANGLAAGNVNKATRRLTSAEKKQASAREKLNALKTELTSSVADMRSARRDYKAARSTYTRTAKNYQRANEGRDQAKIRLSEARGERSGKVATGVAEAAATANRGLDSMGRLLNDSVRAGTKRAADGMLNGPERAKAALQRFGNDVSAAAVQLEAPKR